MLDHIDQKTINLSYLETLVLDEADRVFDMGFLPDIRKIIRHIPAKRQTLLFSATMPDDIRRLAHDILHAPITVQVDHAAPANTVSHALYPVDQHLKTALLLELLRHRPEYASIGSLGTKLGNIDLRNIIYATELCNRYGLNTISTGSYIAWAMELLQRGILRQEMTEIPLNWGDGETILQLIHQIARRKTFGNILAEGALAKKIFGEGSKDYLLDVKNFPIEMTDERLPKSFALGMATSTRGACHMRSRPSLDILGLPKEVLKKIYGGPVSDQFSSYPGNPYSEPRNDSRPPS